MPGKPRLCPACEKPNGLWRGVLVPGWQAVEVAADGTATPARTGWPEREVDWHGFVEADGTYGCSCGWEGVKDDLVVLGWDGKPLPTVSPYQGAFDAR